MQSSFAAIAIIIFLLGSCSCDNSKKSLYWEVEGQRTFFTNDLKRAQDEIPFEIILPTDLPRNLQDEPDIIGILQESWLDTESKLDVSYQAIDEVIVGRVYITEWLYPINLSQPEYDSECQYLNIDGTQIVECANDWNVHSPDGTLLLGFIFYWKYNDTYFRASIHGYGHNEAVKVIESMIQ